MAASGFHDDRVMCAAIAFAVLDEAKPRGADLMRRGGLQCSQKSDKHH